jgi:hypothetical protein
LLALAQTGSDNILLTGFGGGVPSRTTFPVIEAAVDASTFFASGAAAGDAGLAVVLLSEPPHAAIVASRAAHAIAVYLRDITF